MILCLLEWLCLHHFLSWFYERFGKTLLWENFFTLSHYIKESTLLYFLTFCVSIANEIRQRSAQILFADISEILRQKHQLSVILVFYNLLSSTFISPIMSNPLQSESASSSINNSSSTYNVAVQRILDCNQNMVSAMTSAMEVTITSLAERMTFMSIIWLLQLIHCHLLLPIISVKMDRTSAFVKTQNVLTIQKLGKLTKS